MVSFNPTFKISIEEKKDFFSFLKEKAESTRQKINLNSWVRSEAPATVNLVKRSLKQLDIICATYGSNEELSKLSDQDFLTLKNSLASGYSQGSTAFKSKFEADSKGKNLKNDDVLDATLGKVADEITTPLKDQMKKCSNPSCQVQAAQKCAACKMVMYCSKTCQTTHWPDHKEACKRFTKVQQK